MKAYRSAFILFFVAAVQTYGQQATADTIQLTLGPALSGSMHTYASTVTVITGDTGRFVDDLRDVPALALTPSQFIHSEVLAGQPNPSQATVQVDAVYQPGLSPSLSVIGNAGINSAVNGNTANSAGNATLTYQMIIGGPAGAVPVQVHAQLQAGVGPWASYIVQSTAYASFAVQGILADSIFALSNDGYNLVTVNGNESFGAGATYTENGTYTFFTNTIYEITLLAFGATSVFGPNDGQVGVEGWAGSIDPTFTINGPDANLYNIEFSPGSIGAVPEPSTWAMLLIGLAGLGYMGFRQSRRREIATDSVID